MKLVRYEIVGENVWKPTNKILLDASLNDLHLLIYEIRSNLFSKKINLYTCIIHYQTITQLNFEAVDFPGFWDNVGGFLNRYVYHYITDVDT